MPKEFSKYKDRGAYHWRHLSKTPWKHHCYTAARYALILDAAQIKGGESILDLGCGDGALTYLLYQHGAQCTGVDLNDIGLALAKTMFDKRGGEAKFIKYLNEVPSESQDLVICADVIEHVPDPDTLLLEAKRVLKSKGKIIISTPIKLSEHPIDREHIKEYFPSELAIIISNQFIILDHHLELPMFAAYLYYWQPWFLLKLPIIKLVMNVMSAWFKIYTMRGLNALNLHPTLQIVVAHKN
jgi:2-polyprenyl-3-methyl-5-hydroxy-6-metoxy-1,4-benzoquinol methylase